MKKLSLLVALVCASMVAFAGDPIDSEYCGEVMSSGNTEAAFTWETTSEGAVVISISETLGGPMSATHFRGNGINIDKIEVGESREAAADYFDLACGGSSTITLTLKEGKSIVPGTKIYVENKIIEYTTSKDGNAWPTLTFVYTYGGVCHVTPVLTTLDLSVTKNYAKVGEELAMNVGAYDQMGKEMEIEINYEVSPSEAGSVANGVYTPAQAGGATITAKAGELSASLELFGVAGSNVSKEKEIEAGYNPENMGEQASAAVDDDENTAWVTWVDQPAESEWLVVDLGEKTELAGVAILWGNDYSTNYSIQVREDAPTDADKADDSAWETKATVVDAGPNHDIFSDLGGVEARFVRMHSLTRSSNCIRVRELRVFSTTPDAQGTTEIQDGNNQLRSRKVMEDGTMYILRNGVKYSVTGQEIR